MNLSMSFLKSSILCIIAGWSTFAFGDNQTATLSPIFPEDSLPFRVQIEQADFSLPNGLHSGASAVYEGKWLFIAGRTNGMHDFSNTINNFPPQTQNRAVYVVNLKKKTVQFRSLTSIHSGLTQEQLDTLSVTSPQSYQSGRTLYMTGGYGVNSATGQFSTKDVLTAIDIPGLIAWVAHSPYHKTAAKHIRQISNPVFQVTGGYMKQFNKHPTLLVFGQNFQGYYLASSNGQYTNQVRRFRIVDDGTNLGVEVKKPMPSDLNPNFRRRDLNVVPIISNKDGKPRGSLAAFSGVFTPTDGIWTVPVKISSYGRPSMANPEKPQTFKQGMNNYVCPTLGMFSQESSDMYTLFFGGISFGFFSDGQFQTDPEIPFINQITTVQINKKGQYQQYLMANQYPTILSTQSNPGNQLLFGAGATFIPATGISTYRNGVLKLDKLKKQKVVGYIVGGIQSTVPNTSTPSDSAASPYIFKVIVTPK